MSRIFLSTTLLLLSAAAFGSGPDCPPSLMLERSSNRNRVWYWVSRDASGETKIRTLWEMIERGPGIWEELTSLEESRLYGARLQSAGTDFEFFLVGLSDHRLPVIWDRRGCGTFQYAASTGAVMTVEHVYATVGGTFFPSLKELRLHGHGVTDHKPVSVLWEAYPSHD